MSGWRPIESAPKDGRPILVFAPDATEPRVFLLMWTEWVNAEDASDIDGNWKDLADDQEFDASPTHWMPLPSPPGTDREPAAFSRADGDV